MDFAPIFKKVYVAFGRQYVTRLLSSTLKYNEIKKLIIKNREKGLLPIEDNSKAHKFMNAVIGNGCLFCLTRVFYRRIFLPYLKRYVARG